MTKKPMPKSESESYAGQPQPAPMPEYPILRPVPAMPMPTPMPFRDASTSMNEQKPTSASAKVIAMDDYPTGRGGMRIVPMAQQPVQPAVRPSASIGGKPPTVKMPTHP
jgi:hypothetical protein